MGRPKISDRSCMLRRALVQTKQTHTIPAPILVDPPTGSTDKESAALNSKSLSIGPAGGPTNSGRATITFPDNIL